MAAFKGVTRFVLRKAAENMVFKRSRSLFSCRSIGRSGQIAAVHRIVRKNSTGYDETNEEKPIAYSKSPAQEHKVHNTLEYDPQKQSSIRTFIICFGLLSFIIYYGFIREETETEQKLFELNENHKDLGLYKKQEHVIESEVLKR